MLNIFDQHLLLLPTLKKICLLNSILERGNVYLINIKLKRQRDIFFIFVYTRKKCLAVHVFEMKSSLT